MKATGRNWIDPADGLVVAAVITTTGVRILVDAGRRLADEALPSDELSALEDVGSHHQVGLHMQFANGTSLQRAHVLSHELQRTRSSPACPERPPSPTLNPRIAFAPDRFGDDQLVGSIVE
ncbi:MAG: hypothetical protein ACR2NR_08000 [Solirubrobacteraceae bacterium]